MPAYTIYSITLDARAGAGGPRAVSKGYRYVGSSAHAPSCKWQIHRAGGELGDRRTWPRCTCSVARGERVKPVGSNLARDFGVGLDSAHTYTVNLPHRDDAWAAEEALAERLRAEGYLVYTDQRPGGPHGLAPIPHRVNRGPGSKRSLAGRAGLPSLAHFLEQNRAALVEAWWMADGVVDYPSGSNEPGEIEGFASLGRPVGVSALECDQACERALLALAGTGIPVFMDSGAFSEMRFPADGPPQVVAPISDKEWRRRLALYERLGVMLGSQLSVVAPDRVGDQAVTLERLTRYAADLEMLAQLGVRVLVPLQVGERSLEEMDDAVRAVLGDGYEPAIPFNKAPAHLAHLVGFLAHRRPKGLHLLGMGLRNRDAPDVLRALREVVPQARISMDSNKIRAATGWGAGKNRPRPLTLADELALEQVHVEASGAARGLGDDGGRLPDYTDVAMTPSAWLTPKQIRTLCHALRLPNDQRARCIDDIDAFLAEDDDGMSRAASNMRIDVALEELWDTYVKERTARRRRREAVQSTFAPGPAPPKKPPTLQLVQALTADANAYVTERHYLKRGRTMAQLAYWLLWADDVDADALQDLPAVRAAPPERWTVGGHPIDGIVHFALPRVSHRLYGYHPMQVLELARLYLEPDVDGANPTMRAGQATRRGSDQAIRDWPDRYPQLPEPRAVVSWADATRHTGAIYRGAGFIELGLTRGTLTPSAESSEVVQTGEEGAGRSTIRHADLGHAKYAFILPYKPPDAQAHYIQRFQLGGVRRGSASMLCDLVGVTAHELGIRLPATGRWCRYKGGVVEIAIPLMERQADAPAAGDIALALSEAFVEASYELDYTGDAWWEEEIERVTSTTYERVRGKGWHVVPAAAEGPVLHEDLRNPAPVSELVPPAARGVLTRLATYGGYGLPLPFPEPVRWLLDAGLVQSSGCVSAQATVYDRATCQISLSSAGRRTWESLQEEGRAEIARRQVRLFNPQRLPRGREIRWLM